MKPPHPNRVLDPTHPALHFKPLQYAKAFPWRTYPGFALRALPKSLLDKPATVFPDPPISIQPPRSVTLVNKTTRIGDGDETTRESEGERGSRGTVKWAEERGRLSMSLVDLAAKDIGGRVVRVKVLNKMKNAIALVAARGADVVQDAKGAKGIVFREKEAGRDWILRGAWHFFAVVLVSWSVRCPPATGPHSVIARPLV